MKPFSECLSHTTPIPPKRGTTNKNLPTEDVTTAIPRSQLELNHRTMTISPASRFHRRSKGHRIYRIETEDVRHHATKIGCRHRSYCYCRYTANFGQARSCGQVGFFVPTGQSRMSTTTRFLSQTCRQRWLAIRTPKRQRHTQQSIKKNEPQQFPLTKQETDLNS